MISSSKVLRLQRIDSAHLWQLRPQPRAQNAAMSQGGSTKTPGRSVLVPVLWFPNV